MAHLSVEESPIDCGIFARVDDGVYRRRRRICDTVSCESRIYGAIWEIDLKRHTGIILPSIHHFEFRARADYATFNKKKTNDRQILI